MGNYKPRHFPDWKCVDKVLHHMIPQGFTTRECAEAAGITHAQVTRRSATLGIPIANYFGPESKCRSGHRYMEVGYATVTSPRTGNKGRRCNVCYERYKANGAEARRIRRGSKKRVRPAPSITGTMNEANRVAKILRLVDEKWRASMLWERNDIQGQINKLQQRVTA